MRPSAVPPATARLARHITVALLAAVILLAAACGGDDFSTETASVDAEFDRARSSSTAGQAFDAVAAVEEAALEEAEFEEAEALDGEAALADGLETTGSAGGVSAGQLPDLGRDIIYTADLELGTTNVADATREAIATVEGRGGFLFSQNTDGRTDSSSLVFRVFPEQFQPTLERLGSVGRVIGQDISAEDVSSIVVDLESRITTSEASVIRLRALIEDADDIEVIASIENQLLQRETALEQLRGQLRSVRDRVDLATINVTITPLVSHPALTVRTTAYDGHEADIDCLLGAGGASSIRVDGPATLCLHLENIGDSDLTDIVVVDQGRGNVDALELGAPVVLEGDLQLLPPGASAVALFDVEIAEPTVVRLAASAGAIDDDGRATADALTATASPLRLETPPDGGTDFGAIWKGSLEALATVAVVIAIVAVAVAPFLVVALVLWPLATWLWRLAGRPVPSFDFLRSPRPAPSSPPAPPAPGDRILAAPTDETTGDTDADDPGATVSF
ncbi:MAG: DUF4349 domain-containing protein [Actinomycetota bacterium]